jgi:hypothetical protein
MTRRIAGTRMGRLALLFEPRDWWFGAYFGERAIYVGVPLLVLRWEPYLGPER